MMRRLPRRARRCRRGAPDRRYSVDRELSQIVAGNLLEELLRELASSGEAVECDRCALECVAGLRRRREEILPCCGSQRWAHALARLRPLGSCGGAARASDRVWWQLDAADWE